MVLPSQFLRREPALRPLVAATHPPFDDHLSPANEPEMRDAARPPNARAFKNGSDEKGIYRSSARGVAKPRAGDLRASAQSSGSPGLLAFPSESTVSGFVDACGACVYNRGCGWPPCAAHAPGMWSRPAS